VENRKSIIACEHSHFQDADGSPRTVTGLLKLNNLRLDKNSNSGCGNLGLLARNGAHGTVPVWPGRNAICYYFH
jgi:hypothetical protein